MAIIAGEGDASPLPTQSPRADNAGAEGTGPDIPEEGAASTWENGGENHSNFILNIVFLSLIVFPLPLRENPCGHQIWERFPSSLLTNLDWDSGSSSTRSGEGGGGALLELGGDAIDMFAILVPVLGGDGRERRWFSVVPPGFPRWLRAVIVGRGAGAVVGVV